jgi:HEPN domain-containing protein
MANTTQPTEEQSKDVFLLAEAYSAAADVLSEAAKKDAKSKKERVVSFHVAVPILTLDSFAAELYLKSLYLLDRKRSTRGHDLKELFGELSVGCQKSIKAIYAEALKRNQPLITATLKEDPGFDFGLENVLGKSRETFEKIRYAFDGRGPTFYWPVIKLAVRKVITLSLEGSRWEKTK